MDTAFVNELESKKSRQLSRVLSRKYLMLEKSQMEIIAMIRTSLKSRRDCYPWVPVCRQVKHKIGKTRAMVIYRY